LFLDLWKSFITTRHPEYGEGIMVVPILALSKIFLGVYYNLSIWYKLTDKNMYGAMITIVGAAITISVNILLIPMIGYLGSAIATFLCYGFMMIASYVLGQKFYPVPYAWKKLLAYIFIAVLLFGIHQAIRTALENIWIIHITGAVLFTVFLWFIARIEQKEFSRLPVIGKFYGSQKMPTENVNDPNYP
jgi:O-antigen/teichoic acid export membrane protein